MPATYQYLLVDALVLFSVIELTLCLLVCALDRRSTELHGLPASERPRALDPFASWINMLERQRDRREESRYDGVERRSKLLHPNFASK